MDVENRIVMLEILKLMGKHIEFSREVGLQDESLILSDKERKKNTDTYETLCNTTKKKGDVCIRTI